MSSIKEVQEVKMMLRFLGSGAGVEVLCKVL